VHLLLLGRRQGLGVTRHDLVPGLGHSLGLLELALAGKLGRLLDSVDAQDLEVGVLL